MTPTMTAAVTMFFEVGSTLAPLEWIGTACGMLGAAAIFVVGMYEMVASRSSLARGLDLLSRPRSDVRRVGEGLDRAA